jgi:hypothetical protein
MPLRNRGFLQTLALILGLAFLLPGTPLFLGGGARVGGESRWYGTAVVTWGKASRMQYKVQARIGRDYLAAMIGLGLRL